jgi:hypothetical protein
LTGVRRRGVPRDQLVGDRIEILPDVVRLRADPERGVAFAKDERGLPAGRASTDRVPDRTREAVRRLTPAAFATSSSLFGGDFAIDGKTASGGGGDGSHQV